MSFFKSIYYVSTMQLSLKMPCMKMVGHNNFLTIAKALSIMAVVVWHARVGREVGIVLMYFGVPLFFFTSGFFFRPVKTGEELVAFLKRKFKGLYLPYVAWGLFFLLCHNLFVDLHINAATVGDVSNIYDAEDLARNLFELVVKVNSTEVLLGPFWFINILLKIVVGASCGSFLLHRWHVRMPHSVMFILLLLGVGVASWAELDLPVIGRMPLLMFSLVFFYSGYLARKYDVLSVVRPRWVGVSVFVVSVSLLFVDTPIQLIDFDVWEIPLYLVLGLGSIYAVVCVSRLAEVVGIGRWLYGMGRHTLVILALHCLVFKAVSLLKIRIFDLPMIHLSDFPVIEQHHAGFVVPYVLVGIFVPLGLALGWERLKLKVWKRREC